MSAPIENMQENEFCEIEATVASGFENVVKEDAEEKFNVPVDAKRGRIAFKVPMKDVKKVIVYYKTFIDVNYDLPVLF